MRARTCPAPVPHEAPDAPEVRVAPAHHSTEAAARYILKQAGGILQEAGVNVIVEDLEGPAANAILNVADVRECDLIVMGSRGYGRLVSLILGSVSYRVLAQAPVPVLIVKARGQKTS
jgi:nucleotide-binding universal stress UspA family protein